MRKIVYLVLLSALFISCSNVSEVIQPVEKSDTLKDIIISKEADISWTKSLEEDRLTENLYYDDKNISNQISITPEVAALVYDDDEPVFPELKGFASLDISNTPNNIISIVNDFCEAVSKNIYQGPQAYVDSDFIFNYVFFKNDLINSWKKRFNVDFPIEDPSKVKEDTESGEKNAKSAKKIKPIFNKWILGRGFIGDEIVEQPVRFYCKQGYVDVTLYINLDNNKIYQILEDSYDGKK